MASMKYTVWFCAAGALALSACASTTETTGATSTTQSAAAQQQPPAAGAFTDAELRHFLAARAEIQPLTANFASLTPEQRTQVTQQIIEIQARHSITPARYDAIARALRTDTALATRVTGLQGFSDAQLQAFAQASLEIDPINRTLANADAAQRAQATEQIRQILERHNLDGATYNAIATRAQTDQALAARIAALRAPSAQAEPPAGE
jgi:hypothetical protein